MPSGEPAGRRRYEDLGRALLDLDGSKTRPHMGILESNYGLATTLGNMFGA
jgi:hypothetical protein